MMTLQSRSCLERAEQEDTYPHHDNYRLDQHSGSSMPTGDLLLVNPRVVNMMVSDTA